MDMIKCLVWKGHYCFISGGYIPYKEVHIVLYPYTLTMTMLKNHIIQLSPINYLMSVIQFSSIECRQLGYMDSKTRATTSLNITEGCSIFTLDFIIAAVNTFTSKIPITPWGYQLDLFMKLLYSAFNFKLMSDFKLTNISKVK